MLAKFKNSFLSTDVDFFASSYTGDSSRFWTGNEGDPGIVSPQPWLSTHSEAVKLKNVEVRRTGTKSLLIYKCYGQWYLQRGKQC